MTKKSQGDCISREALKEAIRKRLGISSLKYLTEQEMVIVDEIDNAPTVEQEVKLVPMAKVTFDEEKLREIVHKEVIDKIKSGELVLQAEDKWIPVSERLPEETFNPNTQDFGEILCSTIWNDVRVYKFGQPIGSDKAHFWDYGDIVDEFVIAWQPLPEPYKKGGKEE